MLEAVARRIASELDPEEKNAVLDQSVGGSVPSTIDRRLLAASGRALGGAPLTPDQKRRVRAAFLGFCRRSTA
jgi:hypothetical protein